MSHWEDEPLITNKRDQLAFLVGKRISAFERYSFRGYTEPGERGSEKAFETGEGSITLRLEDDPRVVAFWSHESASTLAMDVYEGAELVPAFDPDEFELLASSDDFPTWSSVRSSVVTACGLLEWNRSPLRQGYPEGGGVYIRLDDKQEILIAYQLVSWAKDLVLRGYLSPHITEQLQYLPVQ